VSEEKESPSRPWHERVEVAHDAVERDPNAPVANSWERDADGKGCRLGDEVTSLTQAIQSIANKLAGGNGVSDPKHV
jgi:hypothetical protein